MFSQKSNPDFVFWARIDQARLLLTRLNDEDISCPTIKTLLLRRYTSKLDACVSVYTAWCYLIAYAKKLLNKGEELDLWWETRLNCCSDHIFDQCINKLKYEEAEEMDRMIMPIFSDVLHKTRLPSS